MLWVHHVHTVLYEHHHPLAGGKQHIGASTRRWYDVDCLTGHKRRKGPSRARLSLLEASNPAWRVTAWMSRTKEAQIKRRCTL